MICFMTGNPPSGSITKLLRQSPIKLIYSLSLLHDWCFVIISNKFVDRNFNDVRQFLRDSEYYFFQLDIIDDRNNYLVVDVDVQSLVKIVMLD